MCCFIRLLGPRQDYKPGTEAQVASCSLKSYTIHKAKHFINNNRRSRGSFNFWATRISGLEVTAAGRGPPGALRILRGPDDFRRGALADARREPQESEHRPEGLRIQTGLRFPSRIPLSRRSGKCRLWCASRR